MSSERHARASEIFLAVCDLPPDDRPARLDVACGNDPSLRAAVEELLLHDDARAIVDDPVVGAGWAAGTIRGTPELPGRVGRYDILDVLGQGGMGIVYRARQANPDRLVALKVIRPGMATADLVRRFEYEAQVLGRLRHPGIAQIYEAGAADTGDGQQPFFAMELIDGRPLLEYAREQQLDTRQRLKLLAGICDGVHHAHQKGVIHRDLKPGNVLVETTGQPRIMDFGIARVTDSDVRATTLHTSIGQIIGTIPYMSPEQVAGDPDELDLRSDVYALGVIGYELLAGQLPYALRDTTIAEAARVIRDVEPSRLSAINRAFRGDVDTIIARAIEKDRERRYQSAREFAADIRRYLADEPIIARPPSTFYQCRKFARRNKALVGGVFMAFALLVVAIMGTSYGLIVARSERDAAQRAADKADAVRQFFLTVLTMPDPDRQGRNVTVVEALERAQEEIGTAFPDQPEIRGDVHAEMAFTFSRLGDAELAEHHARAALAIRTETLGETHRDTVISMNNLAFVLLGRLGRREAVEEADALLLRAREILRREYADHPEYAIDVVPNQALSAYQNGRPQEALALTREMLALCREHLGAGAPETISQQQNLAVLLKGQGRLDEALQELERILEVRLRDQGPRHSLTLSAKREVAAAHRDLGQLEKAETLYRELLAEGRDLLGDDHPGPIVLLNELGNCLKMQGRWEESAEVYREALRLARTKLEDSDFLKIVIMDSLALVLTSRDELREAASLHEECLLLLQSSYAHQADAVFRTVFKLVDVLIRDGRLDEALPLCREQLAVAEEAFPDGDETVTNLRSALARCLLRRGAVDEADELLDVCLVEYESMPERSWLAVRALERIVDRYEAADRPDRARAFRAMIEDE